MPWGERSTVSLRREFVMLALRDGVNFSELCRRQGIERRIGYKWLERYRSEGEAGLVDRSRRPLGSPHRTVGKIEAAVIELRSKHPCWGARKLARRLRDLGHEHIPSVSTITAILHRHGLIDPKASASHRAFTRFEHHRPNGLWQMDFKGHFPTSRGRCHPLTMLDDHSRFALKIAACADEQLETVIGAVKSVFRRYGLPDRMLTDNGAPWGSPWNSGETRSFTAFEAWLMRLGIGISHGRPHHPQTQGKDERFHRTLKAEVIGERVWRNLEECDRAFEAWRHVYNSERPHQALGLATPSTRYQLSQRPFPEQLPPIDYGAGAMVRKVQDHGRISLEGYNFDIGKAFIGQTVALWPATTDGRYDVFYCTTKVAEIDLNEALS
jgi:transposase InsO family protein